MKRAVAGIICLLCAIGFAFGAACAEKQADAVWQNATLYLEQSISAEDAQRFVTAGESKNFTAWTQKGNRTVTAPDTGTQVQTPVYELYGSTEYVLPQAPVLSADDPSGCLVAKDTAWKLYGSTDIIGQQIAVKEKSYTIRGIVNVPGSGVFVSVSGKKAVFDRLTIESKNPQDAAQFLLQHGLSGHVLRMDYLKNMDTLSELVPGKWSDFTGWKESLAGRKTKLRQIAQMQKNGIEYEYEKQCGIYWGNRFFQLVSVTATVFLLCGGKRRNLSIKVRKC